ncbi:hypothetical protein KAZ82_02595 [Candidatus Babeliales bacterium]|nr:hypothetical protein [Candidatus Babeliales bacterium]
MKKVLGICCLALCSLSQANWILQSIYLGTHSSLYVAQAYRIKNGKQTLTHLDKKIKSAVKKSVIVLHHRILVPQVNQDTLCLIIKDQNDQAVQYELYVDSQTAVALNAQRAKLKKVFDIPAPKNIIIDVFYARAVLKKGDLVLAYDQVPYHETDSALDIIIHEISKNPVAMSLQLAEPSI